MKFTKAALATHIASVARTATGASASLAQGMWNPEFCSDDGTDYALSICEDLQSKIDEIRNCIAKATSDPA